MQKLLIVAVLLCGIAGAQETIKPPASVFPGRTWIKAEPEELGWSAARLQEARKFFGTLPPSNLVVVDHGRVVAEWGDPGGWDTLNALSRSWVPHP